MSKKLTKEEAEALTSQVVEGFKSLVDIIVKLYEGHAYKALGFKTWDMYCEERLPRDLKYSREEIMLMKNARMSGRAIAAATGVHRSTVDRVSAGGASTPPAELAEVIGIDGKRYEASPAIQERRVKVAELAAEGLSNVAIAERFGINETSVRRDLKAVNAKPAETCKPVEAKVIVYTTLDSYADAVKALLNDLQRLEDEYEKHHHLTGKQFRAWRKLVTAAEVFESEFLKEELEVEAK